MVDVINIFIIDELPIIRFALRSIFTDDPGYSIIGDAGSVKEATALLKVRKPDVITTELAFTGYGDLHLADLEADDETSVLAFTTQDSWDRVEEFVKAGGAGFVSKRSPVSEIRSAIDALAKGRNWISPYLRNVSTVESTVESSIELSDRENEIAVLVARGLSSKQIAAQLCLSIRTVENHRHRIFKRLGIKRSTQLVRYALKYNLISPGEIN